MQIRVRGRHLAVTPHLASFVERRALFSVGRFRHRFDRCSVVFEDVNGPRGGVDTRCAVTLRGETVLRLEHRHSDPFSAAGLVLARLSRALGRRLGGPPPRRAASVRALKRGEA